jgi:pyridoxal/pyridoxine/pyridoxamine kinase
MARVAGIQKAAMASVTSASGTLTKNVVRQPQAPTRTPPMGSRGPTALQRNADPTGAGDAFRALFLAGIFRGLGNQQSAQVGCVMASLVQETTGTQQYEVDPAGFLGRVR